MYQLFLFFHFSALCNSLDYRHRSVLEAEALTNVIILPLRDRDSEVEPFLDALTSVLKPGNNYHVVISEQFDNEFFNRGFLANVGIAKGRKLNSLGCLAINDLCKLPLEGVDYSSCAVPTLLSSEVECFGWGRVYPSWFGGAVIMSDADWTRVNGFSNDFHGWGGEDDELFQRVKINFEVDTPNVPQPGHGRFACDKNKHRTSVLDTVAYGRNVEKLSQIISGSDYWKTDGLNSLKYSVVFEKHEPAGEQRPFALHWYGVTAGPVPDFTQIKVYTPNGICGNQTATPLLRVPSSIEDLALITGCDPENVVFALVSAAMNEYVRLTEWSQLKLFLRTHVTGSGSIVAHKSE